MIYIIGLENNKKFVWESDHKDIKQHHIFTELYVLYDYCRINKPINILYNKEGSINNIFINTVMLYGKENVRGYIYYEDILPDYKNKTLDNEINYYINKSFPIHWFKRNAKNCKSR